METINEPKLATRELTKTEIDIAVAQIADRLMRVHQFSNALDQCMEDYNDEDPECPVFRKYRDRFGIPEGVHPMVEERAPRSYLKTVEKLIRKWVRGELSRDSCAMMYLESVEVFEYDISWVFMEEPSFFYDDRLIDLHASCVRFIDIGSRNFKGKPSTLTVSLLTLNRDPN